ncbi:uncharacterized protein LOC122015920 isoform X4 [Zingiber officinale]|uniref:uncharacterized protein LOC122015920 isoform X4 n=1 Tax=Zingiber officinale TaxID=94328 RepID=UPI001C4C8D7D|nr:uncharacterized protein LOC122015920 isoform X4 [Zingiber officinale]
MRERERERERERIRVCVESEAKGFQRSIARVDEHVGFPATIVRWLVVLRAEARCYFADPSLLGRPPPLRLHGVRCRGCLECCTKPAPTITVDEPSRGLKIQGQTMKKSSVTEEILSTSTHDMENSRAQSQRSMSSISTLAPASLDHHGMGSTSNALEFVNHGLVLWNQTRQQWIGDKKPIVQPRRVQESRLRWNATYDNLLVSNKPFPRPVPLWTCGSRRVCMTNEPQEGLLSNLFKM